ncbi:helix-turn-helix domain-containing protein, partial [Agathobaculum sp.]|uniref:helix-turn-helix domain-containing protein n=1 Tax=Agathobaculum sp. TaxID=2048138 RepID=UPI003A8F402B
MSNENKVQIEWVQCCVAYKPRNIGGQTPIRWKVDPVLFGKRYHEERTKQRLSHEQVREKIMDMTGEDVSVSYLQEIEQGKCNSREWCHYLAKVFDVCPEYFAG